MHTVKISNYRSHLAKYHKEVSKNHDPLRVFGTGGDVVILSADDYESLVENIYILKDKVTMQALMDVRKKVAKGTFKGKNISEVFNDLLDS